MSALALKTDEATGAIRIAGEQFARCFKNA